MIGVSSASNYTNWRHWYTKIILGKLNSKYKQDDYIQTISLQKRTKGTSFLKNTSTTFVHSAVRCFK